MRLIVAAALVASLFAVPALPTASADCTISLQDPKNPQLSNGCTDTSRIKKLVNGTSTTEIRAATDMVVEKAHQQTGMCDLDVPCERLFGTSLGIESDTTGYEDPLTVKFEGYIAGTAHQATVDAEECSLDAQQQPSELFVDGQPCLLAE